MIIDKTLEELTIEFEKLTKEHNKLILKFQKSTEELLQLQEELYEKSPEYVKVECLQCQGKGTIKKDDKLIKCPRCGMKGFIWARLYKGEKSNGN